MTLAAPRARADVPDLSGLGPLLAVGGALALAALAVNTAFTVNDLGAAGRGERPANGWIVAETVVAPIETVAAQALLAAALASADRDGDDAIGPLVGVFPTLWVTTMATHGVWSTANKALDTTALGTLPLPIAADATFTVLAISEGAHGRLIHRKLGVAEALLTAPTIAFGAYRIARVEDARNEWIALTAWSSALFVHGVLSTAFGPSASRAARAARAAWPALRLGPIVVGDRFAHGPGFAVGAAF